MDVKPTDWRMLVLISGLPYFAGKMETDFNELDSKNRYVHCDTYSSLWGRMKFFLLLPFAGAVISANGVSSNSRALNWALRWNKKLILYWQGTDVTIARDSQKDGTIDRRYIDKADHLVVAPWFVEELAEINVKAEYVPYSYVEHIGNDQRYTEFKVLAYLAKGAEGFYGWEYLRALALARPDLKITIVGSEGDGLDAPKNVEILGWVSAEKMLELFRSHAAMVRLTEHDGKSFSVAQALATGCEVIWTYDYPPSHQLQRDSAALLEKIQTLEQEVQKRGMQPNAVNIAHSQRSYERKKVLATLVGKIQNILNG